MHSELLPKILVPAIIVFVLALCRRLAPPRTRIAAYRYDESQTPEPLPPGLIGAAMWAVGIGIALSFFALRMANHSWASIDDPSILTQFPTSVTWGFLPGFAALSVPWPLTVWYLRRVGRWEEADSIEDASDRKGGMDSFRVMKWLSVLLVGPIAVFTLLAIPIHLSIRDAEVRLGRYASLRSETFPFKEARRLTIIDGYKQKNGTVCEAADVLIDFADGRRLRGNQVGDGGTCVRRDVMQLLIRKTGLIPAHAATAEEVPAFVPAR